MILINNTEEQMRLDVLLCTTLKVSRRHSKRICDYNKISAGKIILPGTKLEVSIPEEESLPEHTFSLFDEFEDFYIFEKHKPAHMMQVKGNTSASIESDLKTKFSEIFICQRLDFETLGLFFVAKSKDAFNLFHSEFEKKKVTKYYCAQLERSPDFEIPKIIGGKISYKTHNPVVMKVSDSGSPFEVEITEKKGDFVYVKTHDGLTHIIRLALSSVGYPLKFDTKYGALEKGSFELLAYRIDCFNKSWSIVC